jgi:hypothetical protein
MSYVDVREEDEFDKGKENSRKSFIDQNFYKKKVNGQIFIFVP